MDDPTAFARLVAREVAAEILASNPARVAPLPEYLNTAQAAAFLGLTEAGLETMRKERRGPPYVRASQKFVRYRLPDLRSWMDQFLVEPGVRDA